MPLPMRSTSRPRWRRADAVTRLDQVTLPGATPPSRRQVVRGYLLLPHAVPVVVVMSTTTAFAFVAAGGWPGLTRLVCLLTAMFGSQIAIGAINELVDADLDTIGRPSKPIPAGLVSRRGARLVAAIGLILLVLGSLRFSFIAFLLCLLGTGTGIAYSLWLKRTIWSWLPYLVALPLLPIWVWVALDRFKPGLLLLYPFGAAAVIAVQIAQSLPDVETDREAGIHTLAVSLGITWSRRVCWGAVLLAAIGAALLAPWLTEAPRRVWPAALLALGLIGLNAVIWRGNPATGVTACFPCVAVAIAVLGLGWTLALAGQ